MNNLYDSLIRDSTFDQENAVFIFWYKFYNKNFTMEFQLRAMVLIVNILMTLIVTFKAK